MSQGYYFGPEVDLQEFLRRVWSTITFRVCMLDDVTPYLSLRQDGWIKVKPSEHGLKGLYNGLMRAAYRFRSKTA